MTDDELLATLPAFVRFDTLMKARPAVESGERIIYVEASTEARDQEGEIVLSKALKDSLDVFLKFGVVDLDHKSMPSVAHKYGIPQEDCPKWIVGQPVGVRFDGDKTIVKAQLRQGDSELVVLFAVNNQDDGHWYHNTVVVQDAKNEVDPRAYATPGTDSGNPKHSLLTGVSSFIRRPFVPCQSRQRHPDTVSDSPLMLS